MTRSRAAGPAFAADVACILGFCALGRRNHDEAVTLGDVAWTAWPFLAGLTVAWVIYRAWREPTAIRPTGVRVWLSTVVIAMGLRAGVGEGVAVSFVLVATLVTGLLLLGWRAVGPTVAAARAGRRG